MHQFEKSKQLKLPGKPACKKQAESWTSHEEEAVQQVVESLKVGSGFEHQLPHLYSHVGVGEVTILLNVSRILRNIESLTLKYKEKHWFLLKLSVEKSKTMLLAWNLCRVWMILKAPRMTEMGR